MEAESLLERAKRLSSAATAGPWQVWDGWEYVGGGRDLCIGAGEKWLSNMDHRYSKEHMKGECLDASSVPICSTDITTGCICQGESWTEGECNECKAEVEAITKEQRANADFIAAARELVPALVAEIERLTVLRG